MIKTITYLGKKIFNFEYFTHNNEDMIAVQYFSNDNFFRHATSEKVYPAAQIEYFFNEDNFLIPLICMCCNELIGYAERYQGFGALIEFFNPDFTKNDNLEFEQVNSETVQHISDSVQPGFVCTDCMESMQHDSKISVSYKGRMYTIGHYDCSNDVIYAYEYMKNNVTIEQELLDSIKLILQRKNPEATELKEVNKFLNYYSYGDKEKEFINNTISDHKNNQDVILVNVQSVLGNFSSNEYFIIPNEYFRRD